MNVIQINSISIPITPTFVAPAQTLKSKKPSNTGRVVMAGMEKNRGL